MTHVPPVVGITILTTLCAGGGVAAGVSMVMLHLPQVLEGHLQLRLQCTAPMEEETVAEKAVECCLFSL